MADLLDRIYDTVTQGAVLVGTALGVDMRDVAPPSASSGPPYHVEEVIDGATGKMLFSVTDGSGSSCDVATRAQADALLDALEAKGARVTRGAIAAKATAPQGSASPSRATLPKGSVESR